VEGGESQLEKSKGGRRVAELELQGLEKVKLTRNLRSDSVERVLESLLLVHHPDSLSSSSFTSLDHDGVSDLLSSSHSIVDRLDASSLVGTVGNGDETLRRHLGIGDSSSRPRHARNLSVLSDDGGRDLVSERSHG